jgi:hypothetical protein
MRPVQATRCSTKGVALGMSVRHTIDDSQVVWRFMGMGVDSEFT